MSDKTDKEKLISLLSGLGVPGISRRGKLEVEIKSVDGFYVKTIGIRFNSEGKISVVTPI